MKKLRNSDQFIKLSILFLFNFINAQQEFPVWGDLGNGTYKNPVLFADYNNPDVIKVGNDFYMVAASHHSWVTPYFIQRTW
jgi:hypothetical protein